MAIDYEFDRQIVAATKEGNMDAVERLAALRRHVDGTLQEIGVKQLPVEKLPTEQLRNLFPEARLVDVQGALAIQDRLTFEDYINLHTDSDEPFNLTAYTRAQADDNGILLHTKDAIILGRREIVYVATDGHIEDIDYGAHSGIKYRYPKGLTDISISSASYLAWIEMPRLEDGHYNTQKAKHFLQTPLYANELRQLVKDIAPWPVNITPNDFARYIQRRYRQP